MTTPFMPSPVLRFWEGMLGVLVATWPELADRKISQDSAAERKDWTNLLKSGDLGVPWCIVKLDHAAAQGWGAIPKLQITAEIFYIDGIKQAGEKSVQVTGKQLPATSYVLEKLNQAKEAFYRTSNCGTILDEVGYNGTAENPVNDVMIETGWNFQCASITIQAIVVNI